MIIESNQQTTSAEFIKNAAAMNAFVQNWKKDLARIKLGGGEDAIKKHKSRGKLTARERIEALVDSQTAFLEFSSLIVFNKSMASSKSISFNQFT